MSLYPLLGKNFRNAFILTPMTYDHELEPIFLIMAAMKTLN